ncbi:hypothetical protein B0H11DRAFT_1918964 [Mycena galericulata]|nr:hypothetical protein B0H11DRAFT_1918964 [Mycena galericulata]
MMYEWVRVSAPRPAQLQRAQRSEHGEYAFPGAVKLCRDPKARSASTPPPLTNNRKAGQYNPGEGIRAGTKAANMFRIPHSDIRPVGSVPQMEEKKSLKERMEVIVSVLLQIFRLVNYLNTENKTELAPGWCERSNPGCTSLATNSGKSSSFKRIKCKLSLHLDVDWWEVIPRRVETPINESEPVPDRNTNPRNSKGKWIVAEEVAVRVNAVKSRVTDESDIERRGAGGFSVGSDYFNSAHLVFFLVLAFR